MATTFDCPSCGAPLTTDGKETSIQCEYCGATVIVPAESKQTLPAPPESTPAPEDHPSQMEGPHGKLTVAQMRQMMAHIRAGQLEDATKTFQEGTGASEEMARQTVQMIANQISVSNLIQPAELAAIMRGFAEAARRAQPSAQPEPEPRRRGSGIGCWLVLVILLLVFYFSYTSISPVDLVSSLISGNTSGPVMQTAVAPFHAIATAIAPLIQ